MDNSTIQPLYDKKPCELVTTLIHVPQNEDPHEIDVEATLQFVASNHAVEFDFSAFLYPRDDGSDLERERQRLADEITAVNRLADAVEKFRLDYMTAASAALDKLAAIQQS